MLLLLAWLCVGSGVTVRDIVVDGQDAKPYLEWRTQSDDDAMRGAYHFPVDAVNGAGEEAHLEFQVSADSSCSTVEWLRLSVHLPPGKDPVKVTVVAPKDTVTLHVSPSEDNFAWVDLGAFNLCSSRQLVFAAVRVFGPVDAVRALSRHPVEPTVVTSCMPAWSVWKDVLPTSGDVVVPEGVEVLYDQSLVLDSLVIHGSVLFADDKDLSLDARLIVIEKNGHLKVGYDGCPHQNSVVLTLRGLEPRAGTVEAEYGVASLVVKNGGTLKLVGLADGSASWTRLAASLFAGGEDLISEASIRPGSEVFVVGPRGQTETFIVLSSTSMDGGRAFSHRLDRPALYTHHVAFEVPAPEVGILSRRIVVQGNIDDYTAHPHYLRDGSSTTSASGTSSTATATTSGASTGASIVVLDGGSLLMEGTELLFAGQSSADSSAVQIAGTASMRTVSGCSVHHVFAGCVSLGARAAGNVIKDLVCFEPLAHGVQVFAGTAAAANSNSVQGSLIANAGAAGVNKDGSESASIFSLGQDNSEGYISNAGSFMARRPGVAGIYSTSQDSSVENNVVVGSQLGLWLDMGFTEGAATFFGMNNLFHDCNIGFRAEWPRAGGVVFKYITAYRCDLGVELVGSNMVLRHASLHANGVGALLSGFTAFDLSSVVGATVENSTIQGVTQNLVPPTLERVVGVALGGSADHTVRHCYFKDFVDPIGTQGRFGAVGIVGEDPGASLGSVVKQSSLENVDHAVLLDSDIAGIVVDTDGSLGTGAAGSVIVSGSNSFLKPTAVSCATAQADVAAQAFVCAPSAVDHFAQLFIGTLVLPAKISRVGFGTVHLRHRQSLVVRDGSYQVEHSGRAALLTSTGVPLTGVAHLEPRHTIVLQRDLGSLAPILKVTQPGALPSAAIAPEQSQDDLTGSLNKLAAFYDPTSALVHQRFFQNESASAGPLLMQEHGVSNLQSSCPDNNGDGILDGDGVCDLGETASSGCVADCEVLRATSSQNSVKLYFDSTLAQEIGSATSAEAKRFLEAVRTTVAEKAKLPAGSIVDSFITRDSGGGYVVTLILRTLDEVDSAEKEIKQGDIQVPFNGKTYPAKANPPNKDSPSDPTTLIIGIVVGVIGAVVIVILMLKRKRVPDEHTEYDFVDLDEVHVAHPASMDIDLAAATEIDFSIPPHILASSLDEPMYDMASPLPHSPTAEQVELLSAIAQGDVEYLRKRLHSEWSQSSTPMPASPASSATTNDSQFIQETPTGFLQYGSPSSSYMDVAPDSPASSCNTLQSNTHLLSPSSAMSPPGKQSRPQMTDMTGGAPLVMWATRLESLESLQYLLASGLRADEPCDKGQTALHAVCMGSGSDKFVALLLEHGANPNLADREGSTPFMYACRSGLTSACRLMVQHGANIQFCDARAMNPLMLAAASDHADTLEYVLSVCSDEAFINAVDSTKWTALHWAAAVGADACVTALLQRPHVNMCLQTSKGETPLHLAARDASITTVEALLKGSGEEGNERQVLHMLMEETFDNKSAEQYALSGAHSDSAAIIRARHAELTQKYADGGTTLSPQSLPTETPSPATTSASSPESQPLSASTASSAAPASAVSPESADADELRKEKQRQQSRRKRAKAKVVQNELDEKVRELTEENFRLQAAVAALKMEAAKLQSEVPTD